VQKSGLLKGDHKTFLSALEFGKTGRLLVGSGKP